MRFLQKKYDFYSGRKKKNKGSRRAINKVPQRDASGTLVFFFPPSRNRIFLCGNRIFLFGNRIFFPVTNRIFFCRNRIFFSLEISNSYLLSYIAILGTKRLFDIIAGSPNKKKCKVNFHIKKCNFHIKICDFYIKNTISTLEEKKKKRVPDTP